MAAICLQRAGIPSGGVRRHRRGHLLARGIATLREWRRRIRDRDRLAAFDERMLQDIGLTRADAEFLSHKPFWRE